MSPKGGANPRPWQAARIRRPAPALTVDRGTLSPLRYLGPHWYAAVMGTAYSRPPPVRDGTGPHAYLTARYRNAARSCPASTVGAAANDGPYHVSCRPSTSAAGTPGKASGPSSAVKR